MANSRNRVAFSSTTLPFFSVHIKQSIYQQQRLQIHVHHLFIYYHKREQLQVKSVVRAFICALRAVSVIALEICAVSRMLGMKE